MHNLAAQTYQKTSLATVNPRELEASLLLKAARKLQAVKDGWSGGGQELSDALTFNRRLWTVLATSATHANNPLPRDVKQNIGNLAIFIFNHTLNVTNEPAPERLNSLIQINCMIAEGLRGKS